MPQEEICRNRIISENYRDFIVNQLRGNIFDFYFFRRTLRTEYGILI